MNSVSNLGDSMETCVNLGDMIEKGDRNRENSPCYLVNLDEVNDLEAVRTQKSDLVMTNEINLQ